GRTHQGRAAADPGAPPSPADPRRADHRARPGGAPRSDLRVHGRVAGRQPLGAVLLAQHRRRRAHLRPYHLHRSRARGGEQQQGRLPRPLAPHPAAATRRRRVARATEHRQPQRRRPLRHAGDRPVLRGVRRAARPERARGAAHEPRGDFRRECHAPSRGAWLMNIVTRKLIAKELHVNRLLVGGGVMSGVASVVLAALGQLGFSIGSLIWLSTIIAMGVILALYGIMNERKEHSLEFIMSLPLSVSDYVRAKMLGLALCFFIAWSISVAGALVLVFA